ncbi:hypothetical protein ROA7023_01917 [Roseisalinus antarcticus]|uniref:Uncharacterized protein n=1 Tax=Roseisalinus antarcticus TaxID=254357 RepID=A0A1Y5SQY0_9RHOB|nr:hypothetical protein ROA7023_01917 [Roseisalinus antarcticus]
MRIAVGENVVAFAHLLGIVHCPAGECKPICRERAVSLPICSSAGNWQSRSGKTGASPTWFLAISTARTSGVCSSIPSWIRRQVSHVAPLVRVTLATPLGTAMLAGVPPALALDLDPGAIQRLTAVCLQTMRRDQQVQRSVGAASASRLGAPRHLGVEPDRQRGRSGAHERASVQAGQSLVLSVGGVGRGCRSAHGAELPRWSHEMNPPRDLCDRAHSSEKIPQEVALDWFRLGHCRYRSASCTRATHTHCNDPACFGVREFLADAKDLDRACGWKIRLLRSQPLRRCGIQSGRPGRHGQHPSGLLQLVRASTLRRAGICGQWNTDVEPGLSSVGVPGSSEVVQGPKRGLSSPVMRTPAMRLGAADAQDKAHDLRRMLYRPWLFRGPPLSWTFETR